MPGCILGAWQRTAKWGWRLTRRPGKYAIWCKPTGTWLEGSRDVPVRHDTQAEAHEDIRRNMVHPRNYEVRVYRKIREAVPAG